LLAVVVAVLLAVTQQAAVVLVDTGLQLVLQSALGLQLL
jgi:hypothetical protein